MLHMQQSTNDMLAWINNLGALHHFRNNSRDVHLRAGGSGKQ